ncbi:898_t:CDS:2 [Rhizophagus irregularis]|nr:898_t:CDS:2 [Rhizophagus irregularis]
MKIYMLYIYEQNLFVGYNNSHYENNFGVENSSYFIEEIEVFSVVKK